MGRGMQGPFVSNSVLKLFGDHKAFTANLEIKAEGPSNPNMTMPGKLAFDSGKSRFEMDLGKSSMVPAEAVAQMKAMGMDQMVAISRPDKKAQILVYPGLKAYAEMPMAETDAAKSDKDIKMEITEIGKETLEGHDCVKNKAVITDEEGKKHEAMVWNAADLKKFPVKIQQQDQGKNVTMLFKDVKFEKPDQALFDPPAGFTKYDSMQTMMQQEMMKRMGGGPGAPPGQK